MRNDQYFASILSYLEKLNDLKFSLVVKDSGFDDPAYYDKMALELVMSGQRASSSSNLSSSSLGLPAPEPAPSPAPPQPAQSAYVSAVTAPIAQKQTQPQAAPPPKKTEKIEEAQVAAPQTPGAPAPVEAPPKETTTPTKKRSPTTKRKTRTIIEDTPNSQGAASTTQESFELKSTPVVHVEKPKKLKGKSKPARVAGILTLTPSPLSFPSFLVFYYAFLLRTSLQ